MGQLPIICAMSDTGIAYDWNWMREAAQRGQAFMASSPPRSTPAWRTSSAGRSRLTWLPRRRSPRCCTRTGLGLPVKRRSKKTGKPSTDKLAVKALAGEHPVVKKIQDYRRIKRLCKDNYAGKYEQDYDYARDGRAHPNILACAAVTGRFAIPGLLRSSRPRR